MANAMARVQVDGSLFMVFNRTTGEAMGVIALTEVFQGRAQVIKITVPESQVPDSAVPGTVVRPVGLVCSPWGNPGFNGQINTGLTYRAERIDLATALASAPVSAPVGEARMKSAEAQK